MLLTIICNTGYEYWCGPEDFKIDTYQRDPIGIECTEAQLFDKLRAGQKQEVQVVEVLKLVEQHL